MGGNFPGSSSDAGRIVTLREQIAGLAKDQRPLLFDALVAVDEGTSKGQLDTRARNPFLPLWVRQQTPLSPALSALCALCPEVPAGRLEELLQQMPLTEQEEADFLNNLVLPDAFGEAMNISLDEWSNSLAIDGLSRTRSFNSYTDELARSIVRKLLAAESGRDVLIFDAGASNYAPADTDDNRIILLHDNYGNYSAKDTGNGEITSFKQGTDSFYLAISSQLKADERSSLGMQFEQDVQGFRDVLTQHAIEENRGWFDPGKPTEIESGFLPDWFANATAAEKQSWKMAVQDYSQALLEAQAPDLLDPSGYGQPTNCANMRGKSCRNGFCSTTVLQWILTISACIPSASRLIQALLLIPITNISALQNWSRIMKRISAALQICRWKTLHSPISTFCSPAARLTIRGNWSVSSTPVICSA